MFFGQFFGQFYGHFFGQFLDNFWTISGQFLGQFLWTIYLMSNHIDFVEAHAEESESEDFQKQTLNTFSPTFEWQLISIFFIGTTSCAT